MKAIGWLALIGMSSAGLAAEPAGKCDFPNDQEYLKFAIGEYYVCARDNGVRLEPSGEPAQVVAIAAEAKCANDLAAIVDILNACLEAGAGNRLRTSLKERAITVATAKVVEMRAKKAGVNSP